MSNSNGINLSTEEVYKICKTTIKNRIVCWKKLPELKFKLGRSSCKEFSNTHVKQIYTNGKIKKH